MPGNGRGLYRTLIAVLLFAGIWGLDAWAPKPKRPGEIHLSFVFEKVPLPIPSPPGSFINVLETGGIFTIWPSTTGSNVYWFSESQKSKRGGFVYRCDFVNDEERSVFNIYVSFKVNIRKARRVTKTPESVIVNSSSGKVVLSGDVVRSYDLPAQIARIDGRGGKFTIYLWNNSEQFVEVFAPDYVMMLESEAKPIRVEVKHSRTAITIFPEAYVGM